MNRHRRTCRHVDHTRRPRITFYDEQWQPRATYAQQRDGSLLLVSTTDPPAPELLQAGDRWARIIFDAYGGQWRIGGVVDPPIPDDPLTINCSRWLTPR